LSGVKTCPGCGQPLRPGWRRWYCDAEGCTVQYVLLNKDGSIKSIVYSGVETIGKTK